MVKRCRCGDSGTSEFRLGRKFALEGKALSVNPYSRWVLKGMLWRAGWMSGKKVLTAQRKEARLVRGLVVQK